MSEMNVEIVILAPILVEFEAVCKHLDKLIIAKDDVNTVYQVGEFVGVHKSFQIAVRQTGSRNTDLSIATERAIQFFHPAVVLLVGVAGGIKDVQVGDIVVADRAYNYEAGKINNEGFQARADVGNYSYALIELAKMVRLQKTWQQRSIYSTDGVQVFFGTIASGDKVITNSQHEVYQNIKKHSNDTLAIEMEAIGFAKPFKAYPEILKLNIRGISDLIDNKAMSDAEGNQELAAAHAAAFTFELIHQLDIPKTIKIGAMDIKQIAKKIFTWVFPVLKMEATNVIGNELKEAFNTSILETWEKVKPLFIEEVEELKNNPKDKDIETEIASSGEGKIRRALTKNETLKNELLALLQTVEEENKNESNNSGTTNNFYGNVGIANNVNTNTGTINIGKS